MSYTEENLIRGDIAELSAERTGESEVRAVPEGFVQSRTGRNYYSTRSGDMAGFLFRPTKTSNTKRISIKSSSSWVSGSFVKDMYQLALVDGKLKHRGGISLAFNKEVTGHVALQLEYAQIHALHQENEKLLLALKEHYSLQAESYAESTSLQALANEEVLSNQNTIKATVDESEILHLLQSQPLTIRNIADTLNASTEDTQQAVKNLLNRGLIDKLDSNFIQKVFPFLRKKRPKNSGFSVSVTHFTLTLKGYYRLNPIFTIKR